MARWYRIRLSLASKCRWGFALAVLLIIAAALYVPFRWMDKLVEQGRLALARAEAENALALHCQALGPGEASASLPPLAPEEGERGEIKTARWLPGGPADADVTADDFRYPVVSRRGALDAAGVGRPAAVAHWVSVAQVRRRQAAIVDGEDETTGPLTSTEAFVWRALRSFEEDRDRGELFDPYGLQVAARPTPGGAAPGPFWGGGEAGVGWYLRAVRADGGCLGEGCHGGGERGEVKAPAFAEDELVGVIAVMLPPGQTRLTLLMNRFLVVIAGALAGICAVVAFYLITQRFILEPVRRLRDAAEAMQVEAGERNETAVDVAVPWQNVMTMTREIRTGDEFEQLAKAFEQMLTRLKLTHDRLKETNRALDMQLGDLEARNVALFESNKLKNEFLANVSHELRTPLNAIIGFAEILKDRAEGDQDAKAARYATNVLESGRLLLSLINDLLDLAKIEAGRMEVRWEKCVVGDLAEGLLNLTRLLAEEKQQTVHLYVDESLGIVETDPGKVKQILFNLLSNAIKFTPREGRISLRIERVDEEQMCLQVSDTGPGIPPEQQARVFEKFRQMDGSVTREHSGTGLGLAIVKELVEMLAGRIVLESEVGRGAAFSVYLPIQRPTALSADAADEPDATEQA